MADDPGNQFKAFLAHLHELKESAKPKDERADESGTPLFAKWLEVTGTMSHDVKSHKLDSPGMKSAKPRNESSDDRINGLFEQLIGPSNVTRTDMKSRMLDSPEMESFQGVGRLAKKPDGTTVVHYYFANDAVEATGLCSSGGLAHTECTPLIDDKTRKLAREAMRDIVAESGAKIEFDEVHSLKQADLTFIRSPKSIEEGGPSASGIAGRAGNQNYVVDATDETMAKFRRIAEREISRLSPEQQELFHRELVEKYGENGDIVTIILSQAKKVVFAHEVEHFLGAKHADAPGEVVVTRESNPDQFNQSIMGGASGVSQALNTGKILGQLDVEWYQRHFGVKDLPEGALLAPSVIQTGKSSQKHGR